MILTLFWLQPTVRNILNISTQDTPHTPTPEIEVSENNPYSYNAQSIFIFFHSKCDFYDQINFENKMFYYDIFILRWPRSTKLIPCPSLSFDPRIEKHYPRSIYGVKCIPSQCPLYLNMALVLNLCTVSYANEQYCVTIDLSVLLWAQA